MAKRIPRNARPFNGNMKKVKSDMQQLAKGLNKVKPTVISQNQVNKSNV